MENLIEKKRLVQFDALSHYKKYTDRFDIDSVPRYEREQVARKVADWVLRRLKGDHRTTTTESQERGYKGMGTDRIMRRKTPC